MMASHISMVMERHFYCSSFEMLCNGLTITESEVVKYNHHFTFQSVTDLVGCVFRQIIKSDAILSFDVVCVSSAVIITLCYKEVNK